MANKIDYKKVLVDFIADIDTKPRTDEEIFGAYPEFNNDKALLDAAYQYANTVKANKYDEPTLQSKFPEFFDAAQPTEQPQPTAQAKQVTQPVQGREVKMEEVVRPQGFENVSDEDLNAEIAQLSGHVHEQKARELFRARYGRDYIEPEEPTGNWWQRNFGRRGDAAYDKQRYAEAYLDASRIAEQQDPGQAKRRNERLATLRQEKAYRDRQVAMPKLGEEIKDLQQRILTNEKQDGMDMRGAKHLLNQIIDLYNAPSKYGRGKGVVNWGKGLADQITDYDTWTAGVTELARYGNLNGIVNKMNKGGYDTLTKEEQLLLETFLMSTAVQDMRSDLSTGYEIGKGAAESIPFMVEMYLTAGAGAVAKRGLVQLAERKVGKAFAEKLARSLGGTAIRDAAGNLVERGATQTVAGKVGKTLAYDFAQTAAMPSTYSNIYKDRVTEILQGDGNYGFNDLARSFTGQMVETGTERWGGRLIDRGMSKTIPIDATALWGKNKLFGHFVENYINSPIGETGEEVIAAGVNTLRSFNQFYSNVDEKSVSSNQRLRGELGEMLSPEGLGKTFLIILPMSVFGGGANAAINRMAANAVVKDYGQSRQALQGLLESSGATAEEASRIVSQIEASDSDRAFFDKMSMTYNNLLNKYMAENPNAPIEDVKAYQQQLDQVLGDYTKQAGAYNQMVGDLMEKYEKLPEDEKRNVDSAMEDYMVRSAEELAAKQLQKQEQPIQEVETPTAEVNPQISEQENAFRQQISDELAPNTHKNGYLYPVKQAGENGKAGYIVSGDVVVDESNPGKLSITNSDLVTVKYDDGTVEQMSAKDLDLTAVPMMATDAIESMVEQRIDEFTLQRIANGEEPIMLQDQQGNVEGFFPTDQDGIIEDKHGRRFNIDELGQQGWQAIHMDEQGNTQLVPIEQLRAASQTEDEGQGTIEGEASSVIDGEASDAVPAYPMDEEGNPAWNQIEVPQAAQILYDTFKQNNAAAISYADDQLKEAEKVQKKAAKQKSHSLNIAQRIAEDEQNAQFKAAADAAVKYWQNVKQSISQIKSPEEIAAEEEKRAKDAAIAAARRKTEEGLVGGQPAERWNNAPKIEGNAVTRTLPDGTKITGHYVLAEAGAATPSHNPFNNWNTSEGFPVTEDGRNINDRDYKNDKDAQQITMQIAQTYDGQAVQQVPVVSSEGIVYDGNGRTIAGNIAAANNTDAAYLQALTENAANFGFTPEQVASMQHPRVYLQTDEDMPYNTTTFAKFNAQEKKTMDSVHRAISNAKKLTDAARDGLLRVINSYSSLDAFFASENGAKDILNLLQANNIITEQEAPEWRDKTENGFVLSADGRSGITDLLIGALFDEQTIRMLGNDKGLKQSILRAMPSIIENRQLGDYALTDDINEAIRLLYEARQADMVYKLFVRQGNLIDGYVKDRFSAFSMLLAEEMSSGVDKFRQVLDIYNDSARDDANGQSVMFNRRTPEDIKNQILKRYEKEKQPAEPAGEQPARKEAQPSVPSTPASDEPAAEVTETEKIVPERPNSKQLQGMSYNVAEAEDMLGRMARNILDENGYEDVEIVGTKVIGSRVNGNAREDSDLDCLIEFKGNAREDSLFNLFEEQGIELDGVKVDINPITEGKSGTIEQFMRRSDEYLAEKAATQALYDALAQAEAETDTNPTEAQKKAENYKQGHVTLWELPITIENPKGSIRRGTDANGKQWEQEMHHTYGKIRRTEGVDGDHIDVFIGPNLTSDKVFVVDQRNVDTGEFDEHKCMLGFDSLEDAQNGYLSNYEEGWQGMGTVTEVTIDEFKKWIDSSHRKTKPFAEYKSVKTEGAAATAMEQPAQEQEQPPVRAKHAFEVTISDINGFIDRCANSHFKNYALNNDALDTFYDQQVGKHILAGAPYVDGAYILEVLHTANEELDELKGKRDKYSSIKKRVFSNLVRDIQAGLSQSVSVGENAENSNMVTKNEKNSTKSEEKVPQNLQESEKNSTFAGVNNDNNGDTSTTVPETSPTGAAPQATNGEGAQNAGEAGGLGSNRPTGGSRLPNPQSSQFEQEEQLEREAKANGTWLNFGDIRDSAARRLPSGKEADVFLSQDGKHVIKVIKYFQYSQTPYDFLRDRVELFNLLFPETAYRLLGYTRNAEGQFCPVVEQPFIEGHLLEDYWLATKGKVKYSELEPMLERYMLEKHGMHKYGLNAYEDERYRVQDLHLKNVRIDDEGNMYVIDAVPSYRPTEEKGGDKPTRKQEQTNAQSGTSNSAIVSKQPRNQQQANFESNSVFTADAVAEARKRLAARRNRLNMGLNPEDAYDYTIIAGAYVEQGVRKFADFCKAMIQDLGDAVRPYLQSIYDSLRHDPQVKAQGWNKDFDSHDVVDNFDVDNFAVEEEQPAEETTEPATERTLGTIRQSKNTKTGAEIYVVSLTDHVSNEEFKVLNTRARANGGYYSRFARNRGFIFNTEEDAKRFNTINDEEVTDAQTSANTEAVISQAETVAAEAAAIGQDGEDRSGAEGEQRTEDAPASVGAVGTVKPQAQPELSPEEADAVVTECKEAISKIDETVEHINEQLAVLGYYQADETKDFHEYYGYMKSAEKKAVVDADKLGKQLATDLGIEVNKRKKVASANLSQIGGDVEISLPLPEGRELNIWISVRPNAQVTAAEGHRDDGTTDSLVVQSIMWRVDHQTGYGSNNWEWKEVTYQQLLKNIRRIAKNYLPEVKPEQVDVPELPANPTMMDVVKQATARKEAIAKKRSKNSVQDGQQVLSLFGDAVEDLTEAARREEKEEKDVPQGQVLLKNGELKHILMVSHKHDLTIEGSVPTLESIITTDGESYKPEEIIAYNQDGTVKQLNDNENGNINESTEGAGRTTPEGVNEMGSNGTESDGGQQTGTAQGTSGSRNTGRVAGSDAGQDGGETQQPTATGTEQPRSKRGGASGTAGGVSSGNVLEDPTVEHGDYRADDGSLRTPKEKDTPKNTRNYLYPEDAGEIDNMSPMERLEANVEALEVLRTLLTEEREATPEERATLGKLRGWGGINVPDNYTAKYTPLAMNPLQKRLVAVVNALDPNGERKLLDSLRTASLTSYYTPIPIARAMHAIAEQAGYKGNGNMLDPSMGNGVFEGSMAKGVQQSTNIRGVELDWLTGQIAQKLYPDARINITGFQDAHIPQDYYDYVVSNIPFGSLQITDLDWQKNPSPIRKAAQGKIHNYFAVKMIESTRPGGLCVIMTSNAIMDTAGNDIIRKYITDNCEVLGAVRLPNNTFKGAGTRVVTDVIYLRKFRNAADRDVTLNNADYIENVKTPFEQPTVQELQNKNGVGIGVRYSSYYATHKDNLIGTPVAGGQYSDEAYDQESNLSTDELAQQLETIGRRFMDERKKRFGNITVNTTTPRAEIQERIKERYKGNGRYESSGNIVVQDGKIGKLEGTKEGNMTQLMFAEQKFGSATVAQVTDYANLRSLLKQLIHVQIENYTSDRIDEVRKQMQQAYTAYTKKYGKLCEKKNAFIEEDIDGYQVRALEQWKDGKFVGMADIYTKNTIASERDMNDVSDPQAAVLNSLAEYGNINTEYLQRVLGDNFAEACKGLIFEDPSHQGEYIARDVYLSGDVVTKLEYARQMAEEDSRFQENVTALEAIQPKRKEFGEFPCHMGARWIPVQIYNDFLNEIFGIRGNWKGQKTGITYVEATNEYIFNFVSSEFGGNAAKYATSRKSASDIFQAALLDKDITVKYKDDEGKEHTDQEATDAARDKVAELREAFEDWVPQKPERVQQLTDTYNSVFNRHVLPTYNGQHLNIVGLQGMTLRPHQKDAVWRIINQRGGIVDHIVGAGKSLVMQASIMEMRRMGIAKKPMILALKSTTQQIANEFRQAFPAARVLAPTEADFSTQNRKRFLAQIAVNDYDCIILSHEQYTALDHTEAIKRSFIEDQIAQLDNLLEYLYGQKEESQLTKKQIKGLEKRKENLKERLKKLELIRTDEEFVFENLGVDYLFVDECQAFKNLMFQTSYSQIAGLGNPEGSDRSTKLLYGVRALQEMHQGDMGTVFLSGTTITNSLSELYNIFNYLRPNEMARMGLNTFDAWASTFAVRSTEAEFGATNELKEKSRFRKFEGLQELSRLYTEIADVRNDNNLELPKPKLHTVFVSIPISDTMKKINDAITDMVKNHNGSFFNIKPERVDKYPWSLSATNLAKLATLSPKLIDPSYDDENGKIFHVCENIKKIYDQFNDQKGVQLVFCDAGVPGPGKKYDAYTDIIRRLTKDYGIPRSEIADIHEAGDDAKRQALFKKVNEGKVRIVIGGTKNMGTGVNVQQRVVAMHHLDIPWTPADVNQRNGRGSRQGNEIARDYNNNQVDAYYYAVERTLDTYRYQLQDVKGKMIDSFKMANVGVNEFDEGGGDDNMSPAEMVAILSGNPVILDKAKQDKLVDKLKRLQRSSVTEYARRKSEYELLQKSQSTMQDLIRRNAEDIETLKRNGYEQDAEGNWPTLHPVLSEYERVSSGKTFEKPTELGAAIHARIKETGTAYLYAAGISAKVMPYVDANGETKLGEYELQAQTYSGVRYTVKLSDDDTAAGQAMQNLLRKIYTNAGVYKHRLEEVNNKLEGADPGEYSFPRQAEQDAALAKKREIDAEYNKLIVSDKKPKKTEETPEAQITNLYYPQFTNQTKAQQLATAALVEVLNDNTDLDVFLATDEQMPEDGSEKDVRRVDRTQTNESSYEEYTSQAVTPDEYYYQEFKRKLLEAQRWWARTGNSSRFYEVYNAYENQKFHERYQREQEWLHREEMRRYREEQARRLALDEGSVSDPGRRSTPEMMRTSDGTLYGWAIGDRIYLTKDGLNPNTPIHEYSHIWAKAMMRNNREGWQSIVDIFKGTPFWDEVVNDPNYQGLTTDDAICSEVLARYSGTRGAARMEEAAAELMDEAKRSGSRINIVNTRSLIDKVKDAIRKFWRWVGTNLFDIKHFDDMNDVADRVLYDMLSGTKLGDLKGGISEAMFSPEKQKAWSEWDAAHPRPVYQIGEKLDAYWARYSQWKQERDKFRASMEAAKTAPPVESTPNDRSSSPITTGENGNQAQGSANRPYSMGEFRKSVIIARDAELEEELLARFDKEFGMRRATVEKVTLKNAWKERDRIIENIYQDFVDKFSAIERFQDWIIKEGGEFNEDTMDAHGDTSMSRGRIATAYTYFDRNLLEHIWTAIRDIKTKSEEAAKNGDTTGMGHLNGLNMTWRNVESETDNGRQLTIREIMGVYAQAKDCAEAEDKGLEDRGAAGFENNLGMTFEQVIKAVESRLTTEQINAFWSAVKAANQYALDYQVKGGIITQEQRDKYNRDFYVPQRGWRERDFDGVETKYTKGENDRLYENPFNPALVRARGRTSLASDPFAYIESIGKTSIIQAEHNIVKQRFLELTQANESLGRRSGAWTAYQVYAKNDIDPATGRIRLDANGNPVPPTAVTASPTQEEQEHDRELQSQIDKLRTKRRNKARLYAAMVNRDKIGDKVQEELDKIDDEINDKVSQLYYAGRVTDSMLSQRKRDEKRQHRVVVLKEGRQYVIELRDEELANSINGNFDSHIAKCLKAGKDIKLFAKLTRGYAAMMTQYSPRFAHRNFWRDVQAAVINNASEYGRAFTLKALYNIPAVQKAVWKYIANDMFREQTVYDESTDMGRYLKEYFENGAQTGFSFMLDMQEMAKEVDKRIEGKNRKEKVTDFCLATASCLTEASELTVRFAQYVTARQMGYSEFKAAKMAKSITVNFDQSGLISKELSAYFTFFNANIQGNARFVIPQGKQRPTGGRMAAGFMKWAMKKTLKVGALYAVVGFLSNLLQPDDPDDEIWFTDYDRNAYFIFGKWKLPITHYFRMFWAAGAQAALATQGRKTWTDALSTSMNFALDELVPTSLFQIHNLWDYNSATNEVEFNAKKYAQGAAPSIISPLTDVGLNIDYRGLPVHYENRYKDNQKDISQAKRNTPSPYVVTAEGLHYLSGGDPTVKTKGGVTDGSIDINPSDLQHVVEGWTPGAISSVVQLGMGVYKLFRDGEIDKSDIVFFRDLQRDWQAEQSYKAEYFTLRNRLDVYEQRYNEMNAAQKALEERTERYHAYTAAKEVFNEATKPVYGEDQTFTAGQVKALMEANERVNRDMFDEGWFEGYKYQRAK